MVRASVEEMQRSMVTLNSIAGLRRPKETAEFFDSLERDEQAEWLEDFLGRARFAADGDGPPYACLLDTGVNRGHPMLAPALDADDLHTVEPGWGANDGDGHGTEMAGLALAGDLNDLLADTNPVEIEHPSRIGQAHSSGSRARSGSPSPWVSDGGSGGSGPKLPLRYVEGSSGWR